MKKNVRFTENGIYLESSQTEKEGKEEVSEEKDETSEEKSEV